jgi:AcrR family transcriptional regulator
VAAPEPTLVGTHRALTGSLAAAGVEDAQRARLLDGITRVVAEKGYADATVADVVRAARVSRGTFYALFASKEECFLEAYRHGVDVLHEQIGAATRELTDWREQLRAGLDAYLRTLVAEPLFARTYLLEIHAAGTRAQIVRDEALRRFAERYRASFRLALRDGAGAMPSDAALFVLAAGIDQLICAHVRAGALEDLLGLTDQLTDCAVTFIGAT